MWSVHDSQLFANDDRVFPPTLAMTINAALYDYADRSENGYIPLKYSLEVRDLSAADDRPYDRPAKGGVRVTVGLNDESGESVTPSLITIDMTRYDGGIQITAIRLGSSKMQDSTELTSIRSSNVKGGQLGTKLSGQRPAKRVGQLVMR